MRKRLGDYRILERLEAPGYGQTYLAVQESLERKVLLRVLPCPGPRSLKQFACEAEQIGKLEHPYLARVHEFSVIGTDFFFSQEIVKGPTLDRWIREATLESYLEVMARIADALDYFHNRGLIHRNLRPQNIWVDGQDYPRVGGFGLTRFCHDQSRDHREEARQDPYRSPEQEQGEPVDFRSDLFSLGIILGEGLRDHFFAGKKLPADLNAILRMATASISLDRYLRSSELAADLRRYLRREPIRAAQAGVFSRLGGWSQRRPRMAAALAGLLVLVAGAATMFFQHTDEISCHFDWMQRENRQLRPLAEYLVDQEGGVGQALFQNGLQPLEPTSPKPLWHPAKH